MSKTTTSLRTSENLPNCIMHGDMVVGSANTPQLAAKMVRAFNAHDDMVNMLQECFAYLTLKGATDTPTYKMVCAALAKATEGA
jgi:hypothetical protein